MLKVLVVEDDSNVASLIRMYLEEEGYVPISAADVESAWGLLLTEDPDAAILDVWLFGHEAGWELLDRIRKNEHFTDLPALVLTGASGEEVVERAASYGAEYLGKPFSSAALIDRLRRAIRSAGRSPHTRPVPVALIMAGYRVEGAIHIQTDLPRFSDAWEAVIRDTREFLPVSGAKITTFDGTEVLAETPLVEVRKVEIAVALPLE